ncbi:hypothetical protein CY34DRAFT_88550, partial [Suillus luteus UH-Slu-Lm8-n1]
HNEGIYALALSSNSRILASALFDQTARLWTLDSGQSIGPPLQHARALSTQDELHVFFGMKKYYSLAARTIRRTRGMFLRS